MNEHLRNRIEKARERGRQAREADPDYEATMAMVIADIIGAPVTVDNGDGTFTHTWVAQGRKPIGPDDVAEIWGK